MSSSTLATPHSLKTTPSIPLPKFIYGTAWKKDRSADLVHQAIIAGFRAIDTAAQPRHYNEAGVASGIRRAITERAVKREELYIQTKFTSISGQDPKNMPYDANATLEEQIRSSVASSLANFTFEGQEPYIDALVLHSPLRTLQETFDAWSVFESFVPKQIRTLGISNTSLPVLQSLCAEMNIPPTVVQNRFYGDTRWEIPMRKFCKEGGIVFQSFWTLTGNPALMKSSVVEEVAQELGCEKQMALYALVIGLDGISVLNGTTNEDRMRSDLRWLEKVAHYADTMPKEWEMKVMEFKKMIKED